MDFESLPGVTRAQVVIDLADGTRYTYELNAAGAKVGFDGGHDLALRDMELGPVFLPEIPRVWAQPQIAFAFPLTAKGDPLGARRGPAQVTMARTPPPADDPGRTPWQADRDRAERTGAWPPNWGPYHRHFASDAIHRDGGRECDQPGTPIRVYMFDGDALAAHEAAVSRHAAAQIKDDLRALLAAVDMDHVSTQDRPDLEDRVERLAAAVEGPA